jgi:hypothetical protein
MRRAVLLAWPSKTWSAYAAPFLRATNVAIASIEAKLAKSKSSFSTVMLNCFSMKLYGENRVHDAAFEDVLIVAEIWMAGDPLQIFLDLRFWVHCAHKSSALQE